MRRSALGSSQEAPDRRYPPLSHLPAGHSASSFWAFPCRSRPCSAPCFARLTAFMEARRAGVAAYVGDWDWDAEPESDTGTGTGSTSHPSRRRRGQGPQPWR
ncbi:hypothetical protein GCM10010299_23270 [Streptomyces tanashiensis]|nr:hypothetical protein GCM10010299_23270 [Streptomyces tanashiensis]